MMTRYQFCTGFISGLAISMLLMAMTAYASTLPLDLANEQQVQSSIKTSDGSHLSSAFTAATVKKIDLQQQKITLKHEAIASIRMPAMTMVFKVKDPQLLQGIAVDDSVLFSVEKQGTQLIVVALKKAP